MDNQNEHILLIENDPQIRDLIALQILQPLGYHVNVFESASLVINDIQRIYPDIIITNLLLPGISGKDLLVALNSQGIDIPVIVITPRGHESDALQALRLGASNFITYPIREAEVVNVIEDTLTQLRKRGELEKYSLQMDQMNEELKGVIHNFSEILKIETQISSTEGMQSFYEKFTAVANSITKADSAWLLNIEIPSGKYILRACTNTDRVMRSILHHPYENNLSCLVAASGQVISIQGDAVKRFNLMSDVESILVVPIKHGQEVVGMIAVERKQTVPFNADQQAILVTMAEYAAIFLENSRRFQYLQQHIHHLQQTSIYTKLDSKIKNDLLYQASIELRHLLNTHIQNLNHLSSQGIRKLNPKQTEELTSLLDEADIVMDVTDSLLNISQEEKTNILENSDINEIIRNVVNRSQIIAQANRINIKLELPLQPTIVTVFTAYITKVIEGLISNAVKHSPPKTQISVCAEIKDNYVLVSVKDQGEGINENLVTSLFDKKPSLLKSTGMRFGGIGISLPMIKEIISAHRGEIWVESAHGNGFTISFSIPHKKTN